MAKPRSMLVLSIALASALARADMSDRAMPAPQDVALMLDLDGERAQSVEAILDNSAERACFAFEQIGEPVDDSTRYVLFAAMQAIRKHTEERLSIVLSEDELARVNETLPAIRLPVRETDE